MPHLTPRRRLAATGLLMLLTLVLAGCGLGASSPSAPPSAPPASTPPSAPPVAIDTDALVADPSLDGKLVRVAGFFLATDKGAALCSMVLESYPPQCGGGTVRITGEVPADVMAALDTTSEPGLTKATWGQVEVVGTYRASGADGRPTIEITGITVAPLIEG